MLKMKLFFLTRSGWGAMITRVSSTTWLKGKLHRVVVLPPLLATLNGLFMSIAKIYRRGDKKKPDEWIETKFVDIFMELFSLTMDQSSGIIIRQASIQK